MLNTAKSWAKISMQTFKKITDPIWPLSKAGGHLMARSIEQTVISV
jgi:hypothetical protein